MGRSRTRAVVVCLIAFLGLCVRSGMGRRGGPPPLQPHLRQPALSKPEIEEIRSFASNAYRNEDQMSSFSHFVGRRVKNRPVQSPHHHQQPFAVLMRRPMRPPRNEVIQTSASQNSNSYFAYRPPLSNHILPLPFFAAFKPKRPNPFRRPPPQPFTYSHPPTVFSGEPTAAQIQAEHQKKLEAFVTQQKITGTQQQAQKSPEVPQTPEPVQNNNTTTVDENGVRNQQSFDGKIVKSKELPNQQISNGQSSGSQQQTVPPTIDYMNSYEPSVNFMKPPLPPAVRNVPFQLISQTLPLYQEPSFHQDFSFHSAPRNPNFPVRMPGYYIPPKYSTIPVSYLKTEIVSVDSTTPVAPTASSVSTPSSVANSISITSEIPPTPSSSVFVSGDETASRASGLSAPSQVSAPIIFESARIPEEVAITGGVGYNQRPLTLTPQEQRNVFTAAADSSLVVAPLVFSENSVSPIRNYETIDITNQVLATSTFPSTTQIINQEESTTPEPQVVTRTLPGGKRVRFRKVKKTSAAQRNA